MPLIAALLQALPPATLNSHSFSFLAAVATSLHHASADTLAAAVWRSLLANLSLWQSCAYADQLSILHMLLQFAYSTVASTAKYLRSSLRMEDALDALRCFYKQNVFADSTGPRSGSAVKEPPMNEVNAGIVQGLLEVAVMLVKGGPGGPGAAAQFRALTAAILDCQDASLAADLLQVGPIPSELLAYWLYIGRCAE
jgi:hypothetical protein